MMRNPKRLGAMAVVVGLALSIATPVFAADEATVGYFIVELAKAKRLNAADSSVAVDSLAAVGIRVPSDLDLNSRLTEGDVARLSRLAGVAVSTSRPDQAFDRVQVDRFFTSFAGELASSDSGGLRACTGEDCDNPGNPDVDPSSPFDPFSKGKGKKKGKAKGARTPTEPE